MNKREMLGYLGLCQEARQGTLYNVRKRERERGSEMAKKKRRKNVMKFANRLQI